MKKNRANFRKYLVTGGTVVLALLIAYLYFQKYFRYPWTRDGQVRANVVGVASRVNGPISRIAVADNQRVKQGDLLIEIDPAVYRTAVKKARAALARDTVIHQNALKEQKRRDKLLPQGLIAEEVYQKFQAFCREAGAQADQAQAVLDHALQRLEFTRIYAPVDGYISGLEFGPGTYVREGEPLFALIQLDSYWVAAYFKETHLKNINIGDRVEIILLSAPDRVLKGRVESIGYGIARADGKIEDLLPRIKPTLDWIRLAQRFPVRVKLDEINPSSPLRLGATATVFIRERER